MGRRTMIAAGLLVLGMGCSGGSEPAAQPVTVADADAADQTLSPDDLVVTEDDEVVSGRADERQLDRPAGKPVDTPVETPPDESVGELVAARVTPPARSKPAGPPPVGPPPVGPPPAMPYDEVPVDDLDLSILTEAAEPQPKTPTVQPGMETKTFERVGQAIRLSFDDLDLLKVLGVDKPIPLDVAKSYPDWLQDLDGRRVRLRGFMYPPYEPDGIRKFALARDNEICCFGRDPLAYDILPVTLAEGVTTEYIQARPFDVIGTFHHDPFPSDVRDDDLMQLYSIDEATIEQ